MQRGARLSSFSFVMGGVVGGEGATHHPNIYNIFFCGH